jgi:hypothetical protein
VARSEASSPAVHVSPRFRKVVRPGGSQRGSRAGSRRALEVIDWLP